MALAIMLAAITPASSQQTGSPHIFGEGNSCALLSGAKTEVGSVMYIMGLWSGLNTMNRDNRQVGPADEAFGKILAEFKEHCALRPSESLYRVGVEIYNRHWRRDGKSGG